MVRLPFRFRYEPGNDILTGQAGLGVVGQILSRLPFGKRVQTSKVPGAEHPDISHRDVVVAYLGLLAQGKNDFDHIEAFRKDRFFKTALDLEQVPSSPTLRQRLDQAAANESTVRWGQALNDSSDELLQRYAHLEPIQIGQRQYIPLDMDVSPMDNSKTKKEGVSRTYKGCDGFAPNFAYLGHEGYALAVEFREGKQHCQKGTPAFLAECLKRAQRILPKNPENLEIPETEMAATLLVRLDSGNDSADNIDTCHAAKADFLIKRNLRRERLEDWLALAKTEGTAESLRKGKTLYRGTTMRAPKAGHALERIVYEVVERTSTADGQLLLLPQIDVATYWTSLPDEPAKVLPWYPDHGTMEQYHSEYKTDLDLERLPSGKFATNRLILQMALLVFNVLRVIGQATLADASVPLRTKVQRRRLRTIIQNLVLCAAKLVRHGRTVRVRYARTNPWGDVIGHLYTAFADT